MNTNSNPFLQLPAAITETKLGKLASASFETVRKPLHDKSRVCMVWINYRHPEFNVVSKDPRIISEHNFGAIKLSFLSVFIGFPLKSIKFKCYKCKLMLNGDSS